MAVIAKINNLAQITYRTDLFSQGENSYHLRRNTVKEHVIHNKGTSSEYETDYDILLASYTKHKDIQVKLPDETIHPFEIGYGIGTTNARCPIVIDKIILLGDFTLGGMNYSKLAFEKPAIGLNSSYVAGRQKDFVILDELTQGQDGYLHVTGIEYTPENGYVSVTDKTSDDEIWCDTWELSPGQTTPSINRIQRSQSQFNIGSKWESDAYDKNGDLALDNGGYYQTGVGLSCQFDTASFINMVSIYCPGYNDNPELQNKISTMFEYGGAILTHSDINLNSSKRSNINHSSTLWQQSGGRWVTYTGYLSNIAIPFFSAEERDAAKAAIKYWTRDERIAFDNVYGE